MNIRLQPQRSHHTGARLILVVALLAAALIGAALWVWTRTAAPAPQEGGVEGLLLPGNAEFERYKGLVTLQVQKSTLARNFAGNRVVMVAGVIRNGSDRWVQAVQVQVTLHKGDTPVLRQTRFPVSPGSRAKPIGPQENLPFTVWLEQIPADWAGGRVDVDISGLKFSEFSR